MAKSTAHETPDLNDRIASLLRDLASAQTSPQRRWGYRRAAAAIRNLDRPIQDFIESDGTLRKIPNIGPSSTRVILEVLRTGDSDVVARAVAESGRHSDIERSRQLRSHFLTRARVIAALEDTDLDGPSREDYRGDLQMHSTWSDGSQTLDDIAQAAVARGYEYCAVTDHSYGLPIAGGVAVADLVKQHQEIEAINRRYRGRFTLLKGIEANIRADGTVDMTADELRLLQIVVAAPHSALRSSKDQTARMLHAIAAPGVNILGHPRGRMYGSRPGVTADWPRVFETAAGSGVAIEIDGDPARQDIDYDLARLAVAAGCLFALDSDAHSTSELAYAETAIAHARLARVPSDRVVNCWPLARLLQWAQDSWRR